MSNGKAKEDHHYTMGCAVALDSADEFAAFLLTLDDAEWSEAKRILGTAPLNLTGWGAAATDPSVHAAWCMSVYCTFEEFDQLRKVKREIEPGDPLRDLVYFEELESKEDPGAQTFWEWALTLEPPMVPYVPPEE